jgi:hypothetical protein
MCMEASVRFAQWSEAFANPFGEEFRLLPSGEVPALVELVVIDEFGLRTLCPTLRSWSSSGKTLTATGMEIPLTPKNETLFSKHSQ